MKADSIILLMESNKLNWLKVNRISAKKLSFTQSGTHCINNIFNFIVQRVSLRQNRNIRSAGQGCGSGSGFIWVRGSGYRGIK